MRAEAVDAIASYLRVLLAIALTLADVEALLAALAAAWPQTAVALGDLPDTG